MRGLDPGFAPHSTAKDGIPKTAGKSGPVFTGARGGRLNRRQAARIIENLCRLAGLLQVVSPYSLRHSFATHLLKAGADMRSVQELLGHARLSATERYTHLNLAKLTEVYDKAHPKGRRRWRKGVNETLPGVWIWSGRR